MDKPYFHLPSLAERTHVAVDMRVLRDTRATERLNRFMVNWLSVGGDACYHLLLLAERNADDAARARQAAFVEEWARLWEDGTLLSIRPRTKGRGAAEDMRQWLRDKDGRPEQALLLTTRRSPFIGAFTGGHGTTCGQWTPESCDKTGQRAGFWKLSYTWGRCPGQCVYCYLRAVPGMDLLTVALNLEDMAPEFALLPDDVLVVNASELGDPVAVDRWFVGPSGEGSLVQDVMDMCAEQAVASFWLTKSTYPPYLHVEGRLVHAGVSVNAPEVSAVYEPGAEMPGARVTSLLWMVAGGAIDSVIRFGPFLWQYTHAYQNTVQALAQQTAGHVTRWTLDVPRFSPRMVGLLSEEGQEALLDGIEAGVGKHRWKVWMQNTVYASVRAWLDVAGANDVQVTACKADPNEAQTWCDAGYIVSGPCACHLSDNAKAVVLNRRAELRAVKLRHAGNLQHAGEEGIQ